MLLFLNNYKLGRFVVKLTQDLEKKNHTITETACRAQGQTIL